MVRMYWTRLYLDDIQRNTEWPLMLAVLAVLALTLAPTIPKQASDKNTFSTKLPPDLFDHDWVSSSLALFF